MTFSSYALQFVGFTAGTLLDSGADLLIVESGVTSAAGAASLTPAELTALASAGRQVIGYVNTSVTDHARAYWQSDWVTPEGDEPDVGAISPAAPAWLADNLGLVDFAPEPAGQPAAAEAILVDFRNADWRALVVEQAVSVIRAGFHGVFLDDVARYYEAAQASGAGFDRSLADSMMALVIEVADAVRAVDADAVVIVNSGVYIGGDSTDGTGSALYAAYRAAIDGVLIENQFALGAGSVLRDAALNFPDEAILPLESRARGGDVGAYLNFAGSQGLIPYLAPDESYARFARAPLMGTTASDELAGDAGLPNLMAGLAGADWLSGGAKADEIYGHAGADSLTGGAGADRLFGGKGADRLTGEAGKDHLSGGGGDDVFVFAGTAGRDRITDFQTDRDQIDLSAYDLTFAELADALTDTPGGALLRLSAFGGGALRLVGIAEADLTPGDFIL